ncbi:class D sortase [uncultured Oscillibacter sp.]|uniref:class D sortase n=1 Tax=uncultured Oscillibacter sp. TaxID=876091 RepID=UPI0025DF1FD5|nr:class D sortase [uncultured Oscillibacter sp.]
MAKSTEKRRRGPRLIMALGLALVAAAVVMEAADYPWGRLFGVIPETLPDPAPIVLTGEDADSLLTDEAEPVPEDESGILPGEETETGPPEVYVRLGILKIPSLGVSQHVLEGTGRQMRYGVGHVVGSAGLGQEGNCALSGHRPSPFRYLDKLKEGEKITLGVGEALYTYTVYESFSVLPEETWVLSDIPGETATLTLITCTPYLVSSHRLIVRARLTDTGLNPASS